MAQFNDNFTLSQLYDEIYNETIYEILNSSKIEEETEQYSPKKGYNSTISSEEVDNLCKDLYVNFYKVNEEVFKSAEVESLQNSIEEEVKTPELFSGNSISQLYDQIYNESINEILNPVEDIDNTSQLNENGIDGLCEYLYFENQEVFALAEENNRKNPVKILENKLNNMRTLVQNQEDLNQKNADMLSQIQETRKYLDSLTNQLTHISQQQIKAPKEETMVDEPLNLKKDVEISAEEVYVKVNDWEIDDLFSDLYSTRPTKKTLVEKEVVDEIEEEYEVEEEIQENVSYVQELSNQLSKYIKKSPINEDVLVDPQMQVLEMKIDQLRKIMIESTMVSGLGHMSPGSGEVNIMKMDDIKTGPGLWNPGDALVWDGNKFVPGNSGGGGQSPIAVTETPPANPSNGDLWWNSSVGILYIWYVDNDSAQWVETNPIRP